MKRIYLSIFISILGGLGSQLLHAETANDPDYIPPSNAIFSGIEAPSSVQAPAASSQKQLSEALSQSVGGNKAAPQNRTNDRNSSSNGRGAPLEVQPIPLPDNGAGNVANGAQVANQPAEKIAVPPGGFKIDIDESKYPVIQVYEQEELIELINQHQHLNRIAKIDECQLVKDIQIRAKTVKIPAYEYVWGDMLLTGTCVPKDEEHGLYFLTLAAKQGLPAALRHLAHYYQDGTYVQKDTRYAAILMHEAAGLGLVEAQVDWVNMLVKGMGSPLDYEEAYSWLHHAVIIDKSEHARASKLLNSLAQRMPGKVVERAQRYRWQ